MSMIIFDDDISPNGLSLNEYIKYKNIFPKKTTNSKFKKSPNGDYHILTSLQDINFCIFLRKMFCSNGEFVLDIGTTDKSYNTIFEYSINQLVLNINTLLGMSFELFDKKTDIEKLYIDFTNPTMGLVYEKIFQNTYLTNFLSQTKYQIDRKQTFVSITKI